ncbi:tetratricopeptide repeat protein [Alphaproteobacteria bacterium]|nr:tetratricopeptide repeat protein [Alphaproteobacteria bacterium]
MSANELFNKANKLFLNKDFLRGLKIYEQIWTKYPKNTRLYEEINKKLKKFKKPILQTLSHGEIENFFELEKSGNVSKVITILTDKLKKNPGDILTISLLGNFYNSINDYEKATYFQKTAIQKSPLEGAFYLNISNTLQNKGELDDALKYLNIAKILSLKDMSIDYEIAKLQTKMKNFANADLIYRGLTKEKNINKNVIYSYCDNLIKFKKEKEAIKFIEAYGKSHQIDSYQKLILGLAYFQQKDVKKAIFYFLEALDMKNDNEDALSLLGDCYESLGNSNRAKRNYEEALRINPNHKSSLNNLASSYFFNNDIEKAKKLYNDAIEKVQNNTDAKYYLAQCELSQNNFVNGWLNFTNRWLANGFNSRKFRTNLEKFYLGTDKKNLLVWGEQGIGDQILFLRFLKNLEPYVDNLFVKIDERLHEIIKRFYPKALFFNGSSNSPKDIINSQIPICDLGSLFINNINDVKKNHNKYLISEPKLTNELKKTITNKKKLVCGLSWISKNDDIGSSKSITLEILKPILTLENIIFLDLQYSDTQDERNVFFNEKGIEIKKFDKIDNFKDLNGVTSLIDACDFIITVSNTNAHMAGALGKKTFLLLPKGKGRLWYWSSLKNKSIWYPSIEIIEQNFPGEWRSVIDNLRKKVESFTNG